MKEPSGQGNGAALASGQYDPAVQMAGLTAAFAHTLPAGQMAEHHGPDWATVPYEAPYTPPGQANG